MRDQLTVKELREILEGVPDDALVGWVEVDSNYTTEERLIVGGKWSDYEPSMTAVVLTYGTEYRINEEGELHG